MYTWNSQIKFPVIKSKASRALGENEFDGRPMEIMGKRIFVAIPSYGDKQILYLQDMIDSFHDLCETGAQVTIFLYTIEPYSIEKLSLLNARTKCYHPTGSLNIEVKINAPSLKLHFVDIHRRDFYKYIDDYDLFIFSEDDHHIRPTHVIAYLQETAKLKQRVGKDEFSNYSIGFLRYERDQNAKERFTFDQHDYENSGIHSFDEPKLQRHYVRNQNMPHQGMFMATPEQLNLWKEKCQFDLIDPDNVEREEEKGTPSWHREFVSSLRLFVNDGIKQNCGVTQLFPVDTFEFFMIHHMPDKYYTNPKFDKENTSSSQELHELILDLASSNHHLHYIVGNTGEYNGITMEMSQEYKDDMDHADETIPTDAKHKMNQYYEFVRNGGNLMKTKDP